MRILHTCKSTNNGKFRDMPEKDAGGGRETGNLFGVALSIATSMFYVTIVENGANMHAHAQRLV